MKLFGYVLFDDQPTERKRQIECYDLTRLSSESNLWTGTYSLTQDNLSAENSAVPTDSMHIVFDVEFVLEEVVA
jgi:hypothetical protein